MGRYVKVLYIPTPFVRCRLLRKITSPQRNIPKKNVKTSECMSLYSCHVRVKDSSLFWRELTKLFDSFKILKLTHAYIIGCKKSVDFRPYLVSQGEGCSPMLR